MCIGLPQWISTSVPAAKAKSKARVAAANGEGTPDAELREYLREWRQKTAKGRGIAAFVVMHDTALDELCRVRPRTLSELRGVHGFGVHKVETYGTSILNALEKFRRGARAETSGKEELKPAEETLRLLVAGRSFEEIAKERGRQVSSVVSLVIRLMEKGELEFQQSWITPEKQAQIEDVAARLGRERLKLLKDALPAEISYEQIKLVLARLKQDQAKTSRKPRNPRQIASS